MEESGSRDSVAIDEAQVGGSEVRVLAGQGDKHGTIDDALSTDWEDISTGYLDLCRCRGDVVQRRVGEVQLRDECCESGLVSVRVRASHGLLLVWTLRLARLVICKSQLVARSGEGRDVVRDGGTTSSKAGTNGIGVVVNLELGKDCPL